MKQTIIHLLIFVLILLLSAFSVFAQKEKLTSKNKKAIKAYQSGLQYFEYRKYTGAEDQFNLAVRLDPAFLEPRQMLGTMYEEQKKFPLAIEQYLKIQEIDPNFFPNNFYLLGNLLMKEGRYSEAFDNYNKFLRVTNIRQDIKSDAEAQAEKAEFALSLINNPVPFHPVNLGPEINTAEAEYSPTLTADEEILYFTRLIPRNQNTAHGMPYEEDFFVSRKINGQWKQASPAGHPLNSYGNEGAATISPDGMMFIFTACNRGDGFGSCDLYISKKAGGKWQSPENLGSGINTNSWETQPTIAPDGKTLYFVSSRNGNSDIYFTVLQDDGTWSTPSNLGKPVNTNKTENSPFIHPDGKTLYFMSDGHPGMGSMDIFFSRKQVNGTWTEPKNIGYPINTHKDEGFFIVSASGKTAYYASDQLGGYGKFDLYSFDLPEEARPEPVYYLKGYISDIKTQKPLKAEFVLYNLSTGELVVRSVSDEFDGSFLLCLPTGAPFGLNVNKPGYLFYSDHFSFDQEGVEAKPVLKNIALQPVEEGNVVVLRNIFFDFGSDKLNDESLTELKILIRLLNTNPGMQIEIRGHTDNIGTTQFNKVLSEKRALSVYNFLVQNGIKKERLSYKGFGDTLPVSSNDSEEGRALNRRTEFRVTKI